MTTGNDDGRACKNGGKKAALAAVFGALQLSILLNWQMGGCSHEAACIAATGGTLDPFPLPSCSPNTTSAVYIAYGYEANKESYNILLQSITALRNSHFPGRIRVLSDEATATFANTSLPSHYYQLVDDWESLPLPNLKDKELIPHSNKIRALQARAFVHDVQEFECTLFMDTDTFSHVDTPWTELLSNLELNEVAVAQDCKVPIDGDWIPEYLKQWMPNTGVLALRNTPRTRLVLRDWLDYYKPCNAINVSTCMPGTDQYPFLQLLAKHAVRFERLDRKWNCRCQGCEAIPVTEHPVYALQVLSKDPVAGKSPTESIVCGGVDQCHIIHDHYIRFPPLE